MKWLFRHPVSLFMILLLIIVAGVATTISIRQQLRPSGFVPRFLYVEIYNYRLSPEASDVQVAEPISGLFKTIPDIKRVSARSRESRVSFYIDFNSEANMDTAYLEIENRLERSRSILPDDAKYLIWRWNPDASPIIWAGVKVDPGTDDLQEVLASFERRVLPRLQRLEGVAKVQSHGMDRERVYIRLNPEQLEKYGLTPEQVAAAVRQRDMVASVGEVNDVPVTWIERQTSLAAIGSVAVTPDVRVRDLGMVVKESPPKNSLIRIDGDEFYWLEVSKSDGANVLSTADDVVAKFKDIEKEENGRYEFQIVWNEGEEVRSSINIIKNTAAFAGLIALVVVFVFLRNFAMTGLAALSIPLSILTTIIWLYFTGQSLNILSMMGIMLATGMVVDNGIVVAESIFFRLQQSPKDRVKAIIDGTREVGLPVLMGTATTIAVFLPLILMDGDSNFSFFMSKLGFPVCVALAASLAVALVFVPFLIKKFSIEAKQKHESIAWNRTQGVYARALNFVLDRRLGFTVFLVAFGIVTMAVKDQAAISDQTENESRLRFNAEFDAGISYHDRLKIIDRLEIELAELREKYGITQVRTNASKTGCCAHFRISRDVENKQTNQDLRAELRGALPRMPGVTYEIRGDNEGLGDRGGKNMAFRLGGIDGDVLENLADQIRGSIESIPGVREARIEIDDDQGRNIDIVPTPVTAAYNIRAREIANAVRSQLSQTSLFEMTDLSRVELENRLQMSSLEDLRRLKLTGGVPLGQIADVRYASQKASPRREDGMLMKSIEVFIDDAASLTKQNQARDQVTDLIERLQLPAGYRMENTAFELEQQDDQDSFFALIMAIVLVFLIMGVLFESAVMPLIVLTTVPLAFFGSTWATILSGDSGGVMGGLGMVILVGIVVNNGIVLLDRILHEKEEGVSRHELISRACQRRLRPVLMTATTTIFGLFPMAFGSANIVGIPFAPLGLSIIGGLTVSTMITLFVIPFFYDIVMDVRAFFGRVGFARLPLLHKRLREL